ncbi:hypothetical protein JW865_04630 [Candidatus Bathyarchaeota archaeon]|nr:hypothetical protein [Candidatus Bathyarchaeota archaeon]
MTIIKKSEARIIIFLKNSLKEYRYAQYISAKLDLEYAYTTRIIKSMIIKNWITIHKYNHKKFLILTEEAPITEATNLLSEEKIKEIEQIKLEELM